LHDYQVECINTISKHFEKNNSQIVQLPTGSGKTFIFLNFLKKFAKSGVILCPSIELQEQIFDWGKVFLGEDRIEKGWKKINCPFHVLTLASLNYDNVMHKILKNKFEYVVMDEAHHGCAPTFVKFLDKIKDKKFKLLGLTATPERLDSKNLLNVFGELTFTKNILEMIEMNQLCDIESYKIKTMCNLGFTSTGHDFAQIDLKSLDEEKRNGIIIDTVKNECHDKKTLIFCLNINHSVKIANELKLCGYVAEFIHGKLSYAQRHAILQRFKSGETQILTNCQLLTEGFDEPSIEALVMTRPTRSKSLYCQMIGRGLRKYPGKEVCYLYELADNNHKICTFNVIGGLPSDIPYDYTPGLRASRMRQEIEKIDFDQIFTEKTKHEIFDLGKKTLENMYCGSFLSQPARLKNFGISVPVPEAFSFIELEFIMFLHKLEVKYGYIYKD
jgi:superfamily II DNA or RNA helicase